MTARKQARISAILAGMTLMLTQAAEAAPVACLWQVPGQRVVINLSFMTVASVESESTGFGRSKRFTRISLIEGTYGWVNIPMQEADDEFKYVRMVMARIEECKK